MIGRIKLGSESGQAFPNRLTIVLLLVSLALLSGCGGGNSSASSTPESNDSQSSDSVISDPLSSNPPANNTTIFSGLAQKGPFAPGSFVRIQQLNSDATPTNNSINTLTTGTNASFNFSIPNEWQTTAQPLPIEITVKGNYVDESFSSINSKNATSLTKHEITLNALLAEPADTSVNLLTHWISLRAKFLVSRTDKTLSEALAQAQNELQTYSGIGNADSLDISQSIENASDNLQLLLLSGALQEVASDYQQNSQLVIDQIALDFAEDGVINAEGKTWFKRIQATIQDDPIAKTQQYSNVLTEYLGGAISVGELPPIINIASRPQALAPQTIIANTGESVVLDGSNSFSPIPGSLSFIWVRVDHQTDINASLDNRFIPSPTLTAPDQSAELLYILFVTDARKITDSTLVKVVVNPASVNNSLPIPTPQNLTGDEDTPLNITLSATDANGDSLTYDVGSLPNILSHGILDGTPPNLRYTPFENFSGSDSFNFTASDNFGTSEPAVISITINPVNDKPVVDTSQSVSTDEDTPIAITLTATDVDSTNLSYTIENPPSNGQIRFSSLTEVQYTPNAGFFGQDSFSYSVSDGEAGSDIAIIAINIASVNDHPNAVAPASVLTTNQDTDLAITLAGNDPENDPITFEIVTQPTHGNLIGTAPNLTYQPGAAYTGDDSFIFRVIDSGGLASPQVTVPISVLFVNAQPEADSKSADTISNLAISLELSGSDTDGDTLSFIIKTQPQHGSVSLSGATAVYTPANDFVGNDSFSYVAFDGIDESSLAIVSLTVAAPLNQLPTANAGTTQSVPTLATVNLDGSASSDPDGSIAGYAWTQTAGATVALSNANTATPSFTAPTNAGDLTFSLVVTDNAGATATANVVITVNNQLPTANAGTAQSVQTLATVNLDGSASSDPDGTIASYVWTQTEGAAVTLAGANSATPSFTAPTNADNLTFSLEVTDNAGASATVNVVITVNNQLPIANAGTTQNVQTLETVNLDGSASADPDGSISSYAWTQTGGATVALSDTTIASPSFTAPASAGYLIFSLEVTDNVGAISVASVTTVSVKNANAAELVISEFTTTTSSDYVELFNATDAEIPASGLELWIYPGDGGAPSHEATINKPIPAYTHLLISTTGDIVADFDIEQYGGIQLRDTSGSAIDTVGTTGRSGGGKDEKGSAAVEGGTDGGLGPLPKGSTLAYERLNSGGLGNCIDNNINAIDFVRIDIPEPNRLADGVEHCLLPPSPEAPTPSPPLIVISELRGDGPASGTGSGTDDYVEVFNPGISSVDMSGWKLNTNTHSPAYTFPSGTIIPAGGHYLMGGSGYSSSVAADDTFKGIKNSGYAELVDDNDNRIDLVGLGSGSAEGTNLPNFAGRNRTSYERKSGGADGSCIDTDNNIADFYLRGQENPQNSASTLTPCPTVYYLGTSGTGNTPSSLILPMTSFAPTETVLSNYDTDNDSFAGRLIKKGGSGSNESDSSKVQHWTIDLTSNINFSGKAWLDLHAAIKDFENTKAANVQVYLSECDAGGVSNCSTIASGTISQSPFSPYSTWVNPGVLLTGASRTLNTGTAIKLTVVNNNSSDDDIWVAYGTTNLDAKLLIYKSD